MNGIDPNHFYWFYSTVAQSLAALIGIMGIFAVFKLQIVHNQIEKARLSILDFVIDHIASRDIVGHLSTNELITLLRSNIEEWNNYIQAREKLLKEKHDQLAEFISQKSKGDLNIQTNINSCESNITQLKKQKTKHTNWVTEANQKIDNVKSQHTFLNVFKITTGILMFYFISIFVLSIEALSHSDVYFNSIWLDNFMLFLYTAGLGLMYYIFKSVLQ